MSIFISHASKDKKLADALVDLLQTGMDMSAKEIFCSSLEGIGIPDGQLFSSYIRDRLDQSEIVIALITPSFYESAFCLCELGATWLAKQDRFFPLLVPPLEFDDLRAVLIGMQVAVVTDKNDLNKLCDRLERTGLAKKVATARWEAKRDETLRALKLLIRKSKGFSSVKAEKYQALENKYNALLDTVHSKDEQLALLEEQIERLKELKDNEQVTAVLKETSSESEQFESLVAEFKAIDIPPAAVECLFYNYSSSDGWYPGRDADWNPIDYAIERGFLESDSGLVSICNHPRIRKAEEKLTQLNRFLRSEEAYLFVQELEKEKDYPIRLSNREFWEEYLGLN